MKKKRKREKRLLIYITIYVRVCMNIDTAVLCSQKCFTMLKVNSKALKNYFDRLKFRKIKIEEFLT